MQPDLKPLTPCPFCGSSQGYSLFDATSHRWWNLLCNACGEQVGECRAGAGVAADAKPARWPGADAEWRRQGEYAERLRTALSALVVALDGTSLEAIEEARAAGVVALRGRL